VLPRKHEQVIALEAEAREAWERSKLAEEELQRSWRLVDDLRGKTESVRDLESELQRAWQLVSDFKSKLEGQAGCYQDLQRAWELATELGQKLEVQQRAIEALNQELVRTSCRAGEIESGTASESGGDASDSASRSD
jgi:conjugal transfer/entry exclusion protein